MAGDWIKMRSNLWDHPKVVRIVSAICPQNVRNLSERARILGALFRTWSLADAHTEDGILDGYDAEALDCAVGIEGWSLNLQHVGWLIVEPQRLIVPRFEEHNGDSAKRRAEDAARKKRVRKTSAKCPQNVRKKSDQRREEKRREEVSSSRGAATADQVRIQVADCQHIAAKAFARTGYAGHDAGCVWRAAALVIAGRIREADFFDAVEAVATTSPDNPIAYFRTALVARFPALDEQLQKVRLVPKCPRGPIEHEREPIPRPQLSKVNHDSAAG